MQVMVLAALTEAVWQTGKMVWQDGHVQVDRIGALLVAVFGCVAARADLFATLGVPLTVPYAGAVLTGILVSRGANAIHDIFATIETIKTGRDYSGEA